MKTFQYLVRINKDAESDWGASVPDLPGCVATGKTVDATLRRIERAIELHLRGMREDGLKPPRPRHRTIKPRRTPSGLLRYRRGRGLTRLDELVRRFLSARGDARKLTTDVHARYFGAELNDQSLTPGDNPRIGPTRFGDWLSRSIPQG